MLELRNEKVAIPVVLLAGILWSFGPLVVRHIDQPELVPWQYLLGRGVTIFLILNLTIFTFYYNFFLKTEYLFLLFSIPFFFVGFIDDTKIIENPKTRLALLISTIIGFAIISNLKIDNTGIELLNNILNDYFLFQLIFILLCFLTIINGSNFIDGFNGLLILHSIIIFTILTFINFENYLFTQTLTILFSFFVIIFFNFPKAKFFLGDSGAYTIGFLISYFVIRTANENSDISPIFFCILLFYLFYEVLFSFCRKKILKLNPLKPDHNHLHMIIYRIIDKNILKMKVQMQPNITVMLALTLSRVVEGEIPFTFQRMDSPLSKILTKALIAFRLIQA